MHDTDQLRRCGLTDEDMSNIFEGVFPADMIPTGVRTDFCLIANTDPADKPGQHWVAFGGKNNTYFFFDSYGAIPSIYYPDWYKYDKWKRQCVDLQQFTSDVCGDWCLFWCKAFARLEDPKKIYKIVENFDDDKHNNDEIVVEIAHNQFPRTLNRTEHSLGLGDAVENRIKRQLDGKLKHCKQGCKNRVN